MPTDAEIKRAIARNVRRLRGDRSLAEIARMMSTPRRKVYPSFLSDLENERRLANVADLARLATVFKCLVDDLIDPEFDPDAAEKA